MATKTKSEILKEIATITTVADRSASDLAGDFAASETLRLELLRFMQSGNTDAERDSAQQDRLIRLTEDLANARE